MSAPDLTADGRMVPRRLSRVLLRVTLMLAVSLGLLSGALQIWTDLRQEKDAVQYSAEEFLASVAPSAASAAYNFYLPGAKRAVDGLFTQRAIAGVTIVNEGEIMVSKTREVTPTLPMFGAITASDEVVLSLPLYEPTDGGMDRVIGSISITVDRSIVAPAIVNRMFLYFVLATLKNTILGLLLVAVIYGALTRHVVSLAQAAARWSPTSGTIQVPEPPRLFAQTELEHLGDRIGQLAQTASWKIEEIEQSRAAAELSNNELTKKSDSLSQAVEAQNVVLQQANERLKELAERDALTSLLNRRSFDREAKAAFKTAIAESRSLAAVLIDIDFFKAYNDYYGHQKGDDCLVDVAEVLTNCTQADEMIVARYGGEEFIVLISGADADAASVFADTVHSQLSAADIDHQRSTVSGRLTASIGIAATADMYAGSSASLDQLISAADEALYEAKRNGRNRTELSTREIRERVSQQRLEARLLLDAIEAKAFEPFFQPQFDASSGALVGVEALVRWKQPDGRYLSPYHFLEVADDNGFTTMIDRIVLERVSEFIERVHVQGSSIPRLSVNAPRENIIDQRYVDALIDLHSRSQVQIAVELLETSIFDAPDDALAWQLDAIKDAGIQIEIDDFGTGHTSLMSLMSLRPSRLKIARELVGPMLESNEHLRLVTSVIQIGETLGIDVLAEGVETREASEKLVELGCQLQQGYVYGKPMPAHDLLELLTHQTVDVADYRLVG